MHYEFAFEAWEYHQENFGDSADAVFLKKWVVEPEFLSYVKNLGDEKASSICDSVADMVGNKYRKPTDAQKHVLARTILESPKSLRDVMIEIYGDNIKQLFDSYNAEHEFSAEEKNHAKYLKQLDKQAASSSEPIYGIDMSGKRVAFALTITFVCKPGDERSGITYRASKAAVKSITAGHDAPLAMLNNELIAVSDAELRALGQKDHPAEWYKG
ncbi:hypothetical protein SME22J_11430 [Serratia marcescens]|nr:hypothetical protein SME22J_11430 [Serratia marcescens]